MNPIWDNFFTKNVNSTTIEFLKSISLFDGLKLNELNRLERILHTRHFKKDEVILKEDEPGAALYMLKEGRIDIFINYDTTPILLTSLNKGTFFGELALFDESPRSATIVASKESELIALSKPDFMLFIKKEPTIGNKIMFNLGSILSSRLRVANGQIEELKSQNV